jgi:outer membrane protein assembly factor BamB
VFVTQPALTADGVLYVGFGSPYDRLYALNVGVGLATNSPWSMEAGNPRLTWSVADRHAALP